MSWKCEVIADSSGVWAGNALRFPTAREAEDNVSDLSMRWLAVRQTRVIESSEPANYRYLDGRLAPIEPIPESNVVTLKEDKP